MWPLPVWNAKLYITNFSLNVYLGYSGFEHQIVEIMRVGILILATPH